MVKSAIALATLLASTSLIAAPESLSKVDTTKGEILLEVQANGAVMSRIVKVTIACDLGASGSTKADAEQALQKKQQVVRQNFDAAGLGGASLDFSAPSTGASRYEFATEAVAASAAASAADAAADAIKAASDDHWENNSVARKQRVGISVSSMSEMELARSLFSESDCNEDYNSVRRPNIVLADVENAKIKATTMAIDSAKAQAELYASALGKRVVRIIRVSESGAIKEFLGAESEFILQEMRSDRNRQQPVSNEMPVTASIAVDFVLGPK
ncbi:MAG: SIMPL domain-containing protein [Sphingorhabdus sp.]